MLQFMEKLNSSGKLVKVWNNLFDIRQTELIRILEYIALCILLHGTVKE